MTRASDAIAQGVSTYRRPNQVMAQQRPITCRGNTRSYPDGNESDESRAPRGDIKARKRNSVACARCRKRKIKCTGDLQDGNGCEACQAAGVPSSSCQYLRVNSHHLDEIVQVSDDSDWTFTTPAPANHMARYTTDPSLYAFASASHGSHVPAHYAGSGASYSSAQARPPFPSNYSTSYNSQYDVQRPVQGTSLHVSQGPTPNFPAFDYSQPWPLPSNSRNLSHNLLFDQDSPRYETSTSSYVTSSSSSVPNVAAEGPSIFPGLSPLVHHLPAHGGNRTLPAPMTIQPSFDSINGSMQGNDGDAGLYQQHLEIGTSHGSVKSTSQDMVSATDQVSSTTSSPSETQEMPSFGCIPMTQTASNASIENTSGFRSMDSSAISNVDSYAAGPTSASRNHPRSLISPFDGYSGHRDSHARDRALDPGMAVRNGSVYDPHGRPRILQPQPRRSSSYDLLESSFAGSGKHPAKVLRQSGHGRKPDGKR